MNNIEIYQAENGELDRDSVVAKIATVQKRNREVLLKENKI